MNRSRSAATLFARAWAIDRPLTALAAAMVPALGLYFAGLALDDRLVSGAPVWLKPAKFAASIAIFSTTMVWIFSYLSDRPRLRRTVSRIATAVFAGEMAIITLQAWRGVGSHFNTATAFDMALFAAMGTGILLQTVTTIAVAIAAWRQPFADRAVGTAIRLGLIITIVGSFTGGLMTRPTNAQLDQARATGMMPISGAHTVGAADGGAGMTGTGWSTTHGDLRVPHFVGLHAMQVMPAVLLLPFVRRRRAARAPIVSAAALSYASLFALLLWQALRGEPVLHPGALTAAAYVAWAAVSAFAVLFAASSSSTSRHPRAVTI